MIAGILQRKLCDYTAYFNLCDLTRRDLFLHFLSTIETQFFRKTSTLTTLLHSTRGRIRKMISRKLSKDDLFLLLFPITNVYFVRERFELSIGIYFCEACGAILL